MRIRLKVVLAIAIALAFLMAGGYAATRVIVVDGFLVMERNAAGRELARLRQVVRDRIEALSVKGLDWANWDDTYQFMAERKQAFPTRYLNEFNLARLRLNAMLLFDTGGVPAAGRFLDLSGGVETPPRQSLYDRVAADPGFFLAGTAGILVLPEGPMLVVTHPVRNTKGEGEPRGIFLFGRDLDHEEIESLGRSTGLSLEMAPARGAEALPDFAPGREALYPGGDTSLFFRDENVLDAFLSLPDIQGGPGILLRARLPREVFRRGLLLERYFLLALAAVAVVACLIALFLAQRLILSRLFRLSGEVGGIARDRDITRRIILPGKDEISGLAREVNGMLEELEASEKALRRSEESLSVTMRSVADGVITVDLAGRILFMNRSAERLTGWKAEAAVGLDLPTVFPLHHPKSGAQASLPVDEALRRGQVTSLPPGVMLARNEGGEVELIGTLAPMKGKSGKVVGAVLAFRDMTEHRNFEEELLKARKLESVALLAGGIAQDFDKTLTGVLTNLSMARTLVKGDARTSRFLEEGEKAAQRARFLAGQLLTFSHGGTLVKGRIPAGPVVKDALAAVTHGTKAVAVVNLPLGLWPVEADEAQLGQVFRQLGQNSIDAMPEGGVITVSGENVSLDAFNSLALPPGRYLKVTFEDEGEGIPEAVQPRVFDPFFTTRENRSGLGLAIVFSVVLRHGGRITVRSRRGGGALFTLYLPALPGEDG